jgi:hypothetical protein
MPFMQTQQEHPHSIMAFMDMQQLRIILQHSSSLEVQRMQIPSAVISQRQVPMPMLQVIMHMPFCIIQQDIMEPAIMRHMF